MSPIHPRLFEKADSIARSAQCHTESKAVNMKKKSVKLPISEISSEDGASELLSSPEMHPYVRLMMKGMVDETTVQSELKVIAALPLEKRYVWRVASALKWGFADFESVNVAVDRETLSPDDLVKIAELLRLRPVQFCIFLKTLFGTENMERMMLAAIKAAEQEG
jgi:hypothetical protein